MNSVSTFLIPPLLLFFDLRVKETFYNVYSEGERRTMKCNKGNRKNKQKKKNLTRDLQLIIAWDTEIYTAYLLYIISQFIYKGGTYPRKGRRKKKKLQDGGSTWYINRHDYFWETRFVLSWKYGFSKRRIEKRACSNIQHNDLWTWNEISGSRVPRTPRTKKETLESFRVGNGNFIYAWFLFSSFCMLL